MIQHISHDGRTLETLEFSKTSDHGKNLLFEAVVNGMFYYKLIFMISFLDIQL